MCFRCRMKNYLHRQKNILRGAYPLCLTVQRMQGTCLSVLFIQSPQPNSSGSLLLPFHGYLRYGLSEVCQAFTSFRSIRLHGQPLNIFTIPSGQEVCGVVTGVRCSDHLVLPNIRLQNHNIFMIINCKFSEYAAILFF